MVVRVRLLSVVAEIGWPQDDPATEDNGQNYFATPLFATARY